MHRLDPPAPANLPLPTPPVRRCPQWLERRALEAEGYPCPQYTPALLACVAGKARRLVAAAVARGWTAVTKVRLLRCVAYLWPFRSAHVPASGLPVDASCHI